MRKRSGNVTVTGGKDATQRHIAGDAVLSVCMPVTLPPPKGWRWVALSDIAKMESGHTPSRLHPEYWTGDIPWIAVGDAGKNHGRTITETVEYTNQLGIDNSSARLLPKGTVCLSRGGTVGYVTILGRPMATSQGFANWICGDQLDPSFLKYLFLREEQALHRFAIGATIQTIYYPDIKAFHVCIPAVSEQKRIVGILDKAFFDLDALQANTESNLKNSRELFASHLQTVFTMEEHGWTTVDLEKVGAIQTGSTPKTSDATNYGDFIPFIKPGDFGLDGRLNYKNEGLSEKGLALARKVPAGSVLMVCIGATIGKCGYTEREIVTNQQINSLKPDSNINYRLVYYQMLSGRFQRSVRQHASQATLPIINKSKWSALKISVPTSLSEQDRIVRQLDALAAEIEGLAELCKRKLAATDALRSSILRQAFSGAV